VALSECIGSAFSTIWYAFNLVENYDGAVPATKSCS
jgi:hypothetical protein